MVEIITILANLRAWVKQNFEGRFHVEAIEINPVIFPSVQQTLKKEFFAKSPGVADLGFGIYSIEGVKIIKSTDPLSGIHIRLQEELRPDPLYGEMGYFEEEKKDEKGTDEA